MNGDSVQNDNEDMDEQIEVIERSLERADPKPVRLSLHMIVKRHLPPDGKEWSQDKILQALSEITHLRLDREKIPEIDSMELLSSKITNIYLQQNLIKKIENLDIFTDLKFLTLSGNQISTVENIKHLNKLTFLELSDNVIESYETDEFPKSLIILNLEKNPCTELPNHRQILLKALPRLKQLDTVEVRNAEKRQAGFEVVSSDEEEEEEDEEDEGGESKSAQDEEPDLLDDFKELALEILMRSQDRVEDDHRAHKYHSAQIDKICEKSQLPLPSSRQSPR